MGYGEFFSPSTSHFCSFSLVREMLALAELAISSESDIRSSPSPRERSTTMTSPPP